MGVFNRDERQTLRGIQGHVRTVALESRVLVEQVGTVDVYFHPTNPSPYLNCAMPHKGVAWVRREDLLAAFEGLERLGRLPRLVFLDALFPEAFRQQIGLMGLTPEDRRAVMVFHPLLGPDVPGEIPLGRLPETLAPPVTARIAAAEIELATWLRIFRAAYYNAESVMIAPGEIQPLYEAIRKSESAFVIASYEGSPLGAARVGLRPPTAQLEVVATAPLWHGMGLENALIATATRAALDQGCDTIFTIAPPDDQIHTYLRLGFVEVTHILTFWRAEDQLQPTAPASITTPFTTGES